MAKKPPAKYPGSGDLAPGRYLAAVGKESDAHRVVGEMHINAKGLERNIEVGNRAARRRRKVAHVADVEQYGYCKGCGETDDCMGRFEGDYD